MKFLLSIIISVVIFFAGGCAAHSSNETQPSDGNANQNHKGLIASTSHSKDTDDLQRLALLWKNRGGLRAMSDYRIGPGDVLEISVPGMEELKASLVRVSNEGTLSLPFVGVVQVGGSTEREIKQDLAQRIEKDYMHNPQVNVQVREYHARQVAITGAVAKPGLYSLTKGVETLLDAISLAGGTTKEAAPRILFIAAESIEDPKEKGLVPNSPIEPAAVNSILRRADPIVIDIDRLAREGNQVYLALPIRPGDVIMVPGSGEVLVEGWVEKPGSYKITPGLTLLGALAAAGGSTFAADAGAVALLRTTKNGEKLLFSADLNKIRQGEEPDIPVQEGDVVEVPSSGLRLIAYGLYRFFSTAMHVGATVPLK